MPWPVVPPPPAKIPKHNLLELGKQLSLAMVRAGCAPCPELVRGQLHGTERSCSRVGSRAHWFQAPQEVALTPGAWGGGGIKPGVQGRKLLTRRAKDRVVPYLRSHPCAPPLAVSCLPCPPESCMLPTPSTQESDKVTHLAGKTTRGKPSGHPPTHPCLSWGQAITHWPM